VSEMNISRASESRSPAGDIGPKQKACSWPCALTSGCASTNVRSKTSRERVRNVMVFFLLAALALQERSKARASFCSS
jgi:hypothetical protein